GVGGARLRGRDLVVGRPVGAGGGGGGGGRVLAARALESEVLRRERLGVGDRVGLRDLAELGVGVAVAVGVLEDEVAAELCVLADLLDDAVVDGDHRRVKARVDVDRAPVGDGGDDVGGVAGGPAPGL